MENKIAAQLRQNILEELDKLNENIIFLSEIAQCGPHLHQGTDCACVEARDVIIQFADFIHVHLPIYNNIRQIVDSDPEFKNIYPDMFKTMENNMENTNKWCHEECKKYYISLFDDEEFPGACCENCIDEKCKYDHGEYRDWFDNSALSGR